MRFNSLLLIILFSVPVFSVNAGTLCEDLHLKTEEELNLSRWGMIKLGLRLRFNPGSLTPPKYHYLSKIPKIRGKRSKKTKNYIFFFTPPKYVTESESFQESFQQYLKLKKEIFKIQREVSPLKRTVDIQDCERKKRELGINEKEILNTIKAFQKLKLEKNFYDMKKISGSLNIKHFKFYNEWHIRPVMDINDLWNQLSGPMTENIVIVSHADKLGVIYDSLHNPIHPSFFKMLSPSVRSLSIFSCYGDKVFKHYDLDKLNQERTTVYRDSFLTTVRDNWYFPGKAVYKGLKSFLYKIDKKIFRYKKRVHPLVLAEERRDLNYHFKINAKSTIPVGQLALFVNGVFVYALDRLKIGWWNLQDIPHSLIKDNGPNKITIKKLNKHFDAYQKLDLDLRIYGNNGRLIETERRNIIKENKLNKIFIKFHL
jgi:hypothetical protein